MDAKLGSREELTSLPHCYFVEKHCKNPWKRGCWLNEENEKKS